MGRSSEEDADPFDTGMALDSCAMSACKPAKAPSSTRKSKQNKRLAADRRGKFCPLENLEMDHDDHRMHVRSTPSWVQSSADCSVLDEDADYL